MINIVVSRKGLRISILLIGGSFLALLFVFKNPKSNIDIIIKIFGIK